LSEINLTVVSPFRIFATSMRLFFFLFISVNLQAQHITQGPVIGAVTFTSAKMYLRAEQTRSFRVELSATEKFEQVFSFLGTPRAELDNSVIVDLNGLNPNITYYYRIYADEKLDSIDGHFRTFPATGEKGQYVFVTGSCQETENMKVFDLLPKHNPYFMLHTGDYTYPDYQIRGDYSADYATVAYSYHKRYDEKVMKEMLRYVPIDYIYDDNDYVGGGGGRSNKNFFHSVREGPLRVTYTFDEPEFPASWRRNVIRGYADFFPGYALPDTLEGIYHSFVLGNAEFFFLDRCSARKYGQSYAFEYDEKKNKWKFNPPDDHCMFCPKQMEWLKAGLKNSTADWKFIVSGVPLNKSLDKLIDAGIKLQRFNMKGYDGIHMAMGFSNYGPGYPVEMNAFYDFLEKEELRNIIVISGDTHHNVMDDGENAGLPELNASGLSVAGTELAYYMKLIGALTGTFNLKKDVWNQGGNGIGNKNFKNAFGKVKIVRDEYVELSIIDEDDEVVASFRVMHSSQGR